MRKVSHEKLVYDYAKHYIEAFDWYIFPTNSILPNGKCSCGEQGCSEGKHPLTYNGLKGATKDIAVLDKWFSDWPFMNIAIPTGEINRIFVLDVDEVKGKRSLLSLQDTLPLTASSTTGKGTHYLFNYPKDIKIGNKVGFISGLDIRGNGGYIIAPPSTHYSGNNYQWNDDSDIADAPEWFIELILNPPSIELSEEEASKGYTIKDGKVSIIKPDFYGAKALQNELLKLQSTVSGRNNMLNRCTYYLFQLVAGGVLDYNLVYESLFYTAKNTGLSDSEIKSTMRSGIRGGMSKPRGRC